MGDGICDDGNYTFNGVAIDFNCEEFQYDEGDCDDDSVLGRQVISYERYMSNNVFSTDANENENCNFVPNSKNGETYYIIHPVLKHIAILAKS